ncbi:Tetraspanin-9 [Liparis tanakae]|uniref:Tetraspanin-9 n=1 Tax=Liparis tanakae TaxID=230148 RepID=A0A4Z2G8I2_9TELE|nr:Tetraspanin-9 [Liparis tanakae]
MPAQVRGIDRDPGNQGMKQARDYSWSAQIRRDGFTLCGCGLLGVGIWLSVSQGSFATFSPSFPSLSAANMVIAIGAIVMVTGFLGCLGAIKENKCLLLSMNTNAGHLRGFGHIPGE